MNRPDPKPISEMSVSEIVDRLNRLDYLYRAMQDARDAFIAHPTLVNERRWTFCSRRYWEYVDEWQP